MDIRYVEISNLKFCDTLYSSFVNERDRILITRWRISCHNLRTETGRYDNPPTPRNERVCLTCLIVEDETHALFHCICHSFIRLRYNNLFQKYHTVSEILSPVTLEDVSLVANLIKDIERNMTQLKMVQTVYLLICFVCCTLLT